MLLYDLYVFACFCSYIFGCDMQPVFGQVAPPTGLEFEKTKVFDIWNFGSKQKPFWGPTDALKLWFKKRVPCCFFIQFKFDWYFCL